MRKFLFLILGFFVWQSALVAQISTTLKTTSIKFLDGSTPMAYIYTYPADTAKDNTWFIKNFRYDLSGRQIVYGIDITQLWDTLNANLVLEASVDSANWNGIDSLTTIALQTVAHKEKAVNLATQQWAYWRLRLGVGNAAYHGNILNPGAIKFFILTDLFERH